jgi:hypothetical protein
MANDYIEDWKEAHKTLLALLDDVVAKRHHEHYMKEIMVRTMGLLYSAKIRNYKRLFSGIIEINQNMGRRLYNTSTVHDIRGRFADTLRALDKYEPIFMFLKHEEIEAKIAELKKEGAA